MQERNAKERAERKRKLADLLDKYGESKEAIDKNADIKDSFEYMLANQNGLIDEVLNERRMTREKSNFPQTPYPIAARKNQNYVVPRNLPEMEEDDVIQDRLRREKRNMLLERARDTINKFEGKADYFYLDTKGNISTAQGANVDNYDVFMGLDSYKGNRLSSVSEREDTYNLLKNKKRKGEYGQNYKANYYKSVSPLRIKQETIDRLLNTHLENDINSLQKTFPEFSNFPLPLQEVLTDIHYNTGNVSQSNWPNLHQGIKTKNLSLIAKHVHRKDVQKARNDWALERIKSISKW